MKQDKTDEFIANPKASVIKISLPIMVGMTVQTLYSIVDTAYIGRLGSDYIAALTLAFPIFIMLIGINSAIGVGMSSRISRFLGEKNKAGAENAAVHGLFLSLIIGFAVFIIGMIVLRPLFNLFGADGNVTELGISYMRIVLSGIFFMLPSFVIGSIFQAQGDTKVSMIVQVIGLIVNIILDPIFIYTLNLGVVGAAIATVIGFAVSLALYCYFLHFRSFLHMRYKSFKFSYQLTKEIISVGIPAGLVMIINSLYVIFINYYMVHYGTVYVAAFGIGTRLESLGIMPVVAISFGLMTVSGMLYGAKKFSLLRETILHAMTICVSYTLILGLALYFFSPLLFRIFTTDKALISIATQYMRVDVLTFPLMAITFTLSRVMQAMGYGMPSLIVNLVRVIFVAVPCGYIFVFVLHYGFISIAWSMVLGGLSSTILAYYFLNSELKKAESAALS